MPSIINILLIALIFIAIVFAIIKINKKSRWKIPATNFSDEWRKILMKNVSFYNILSQEQKKVFEYEIQEFLLNCKITGISTTIDDTDRILVASSAVIPIFAFPDWKYYNLQEVLIYPEKFNENFETGNSESILGMVGTGYMEGKMILSQTALHQGFKNEADKKNTAIHEFVHLIDKYDGATDGIPEILLEKQYIIPWIDLMQKKIDEIYDDKSDINPYGATSKTEFFPVVSEYFFEKPTLLKEKHPEIYFYLEKIFRQKLSNVNFTKQKTKLGRNDDCLCGSGKKYKHCCGK